MNMGPVWDSPADSSSQRIILNDSVREGEESPEKAEKEVQGIVDGKSLKEKIFSNQYNEKKFNPFEDTSQATQDNDSQKQPRRSVPKKKNSDLLGDL
jgi:hypothetical protein